MSDVSLQGFGAGTVIDHQVMTHPDLEAVNTAKKQTRSRRARARAPRSPTARSAREAAAVLVPDDPDRQGLTQLHIKPH